MNPKHRARIVVQQREDIDRISNLPDDVISRILSLMPTKFTVRTSILSNRWKYLWTFITNLDFDYGRKYVCPEPSFIEFIDGVLRLCKSSQIQLFRLSCYKFENSALSVSRWIGEAIRLHASEIVVKVPNHNVPLSLFTCKTLTTLKLHSFGSEIPSSVCIPNLKILSISKVDEDMFERLICGCPMLEDLNFIGEITNQKKFVLSISTLTMKRLTFRLDVLVEQRTEIVINTPNLECLDISNILKFRLEKLQSLVEASLCLWYRHDSDSDSDSDSEGEDEDEYEYEYDNRFWGWESKRDRIIELLREMSGVKSLSLYFAAESRAVLEFLRDTKLPMFHYLTCLKMAFPDFNSCKYLPLLLESSPNLEYLSLEKWIFWCDNPLVRLKFVSGCPLLHLEEIKLDGFEGKKKEDLPIVEYLLKNAKVLKRLKIICKRTTLEKERESYNTFLQSWKASRTCEIEFHGRYLQTPSIQCRKRDAPQMQKGADARFPPKALRFSRSMSYFAAGRPIVVEIISSKAID